MRKHGCYSRCCSLFLCFSLCLALAVFMQPGSARAERPEIGTVIDHTNWQMYQEYLAPSVRILMQKNQISYRVVERHKHVYMPIEPWTEKCKGQARLGENEELLNYCGGGIPFPEIDMNDPDAAAKVNWNQDKRYTGDTAVYSPADVILVDKKGHERSFTAEMLYYKATERYVLDPVPTIPGTKVRAYMRINTLSPYDMKGFAVVMHIAMQELELPDQQWAYIPVLRRVRRMSTSLKGDAFAGTDLTYADSYPGAPDEFTHKMLGFREMLVGAYCDQKCIEYIMGKRQGFKFYDVPVEFMPVYIFEAIAKDKNYHYSKYVYYIDNEYWGINFKECYDPKGDLWKLHTFYGVVATGAAGASFSTMMDMQSEHMTIGDSRHYKFNVDLPVKEFSPSRLKEIGK